MIHGNYEISFPLCISLIRRDFQKSKMKNETDVVSCLRSEAKIIKYHGSIEAYLDRNRSKYASDFKFRCHRIAKQQNIRSARIGCAGKISGSDVEFIFRKFNHQCASCTSTSFLAIDHIFPIALRGKNKLDNLQLLCRACNSSKGARIMDKSEIIRHAMSLLGKKKSKAKKKASIANLAAARASGKRGGWPKGRPRKPKKK